LEHSNIPRDDGLACGDYIEQLTFLLFSQDGGLAGGAAVQHAVADP
jgi:hypothetical protein